MRELKFSQLPATLATYAVHDPEIGTAVNPEIVQEVKVVPCFTFVAQSSERVQGKSGIAQPGEAIIPVALTTDNFRK
jgi:hypothetical protein